MLKITLPIFKLALAFLLAASIGVHSLAAETNTDQTSPSKIYWSDGDSGRINGIPFRLANIDAPETGGIGSRGGAKCEAERVLGYKAKEFIVEFSRGKTIKITNNYGYDKYDRLVVDLEANGKDIGQVGLQTKILAPWPHKKSRALSKKPSWCKIEE